MCARWSPRREWLCVVGVRCVCVWRGRVRCVSVACVRGCVCGIVACECVCGVCVCACGACVWRVCLVSVSAVCVCECGGVSAVWRV